MKKILTLIIAVLMTVCVSSTLIACGKKGDLEYVQDKGKLIVGITDYEPMDYKDENGNWIGFDAELSKEFAKSLGVDVEFVELSDWDKKTIEIESKNIDLIWNGMTADDELGKSIDFSISYALNFQCAVVKNDSTISTIDDIKKASIAVENGSAGNNVAKEDLGKTDDDLNSVNSQVKALLEVISGNSSVAIVDFTLAQSVVGKNSYDNLKIVNTDNVKFSEEIFAVGLRKGSDLKESLDKFLKDKYKDGSLKKLTEKYQVALNEEELKK